jgi:hypothetical protein
MVRMFAGMLGQQMYDPEFEEKQMIFDKQQGAIKRIDRQEEAELLHGEEAGMIFKYDLPILNMPLKFNNKLAVIDEGAETVTET